MKEIKYFVCTNIYNRTHTITQYVETLLEKSKSKFHLYLVVNWDDDFKKNFAMDQVKYQLDKVNWKKFGMTTWESHSCYSLVDSPNIGLSGYNFGIEAAKFFDKPILLMNDDTIPVTNHFDEKLLTYPTKANLLGKEVDVDFSKIGAIGACTKLCGCMRHQEYDPVNKKGSIQIDFITGHLMLVTTNALKKGFRFEEKYCLGFGPYDVYTSQWMCLNELNSFVNQEVEFTFHEDKENSFHNGDFTKFTAKLTPNWKRMNDLLHNEYQPMHKAKWGGENKWYF